VTSKSATTRKVTGPVRRAGLEPTTSESRRKVLAAAYNLFSRHGIKAVGVSAIIAEADVAKKTFYRYFPSKQELVLAFLQTREQLWTVEWLEAEVQRRAATPTQRLLAIFEIFDEWFHREDFEGCSFINLLLEIDEPGPVRQATAKHLANIREFVRGLAREAGVNRPDDFAHEWHLIMKGSIVAAGEGDNLAARRARHLGLLLLESEGKGGRADRRPPRRAARSSGPETTASRRK
jgi:AcrR family transcriptional regulator